MPLTQSSFQVSGKWKQTKTNSAFDETMQGPDDVGVLVRPAVATYNHVFLTDGTLAAAATVTLDLYSFTNKVCEAVTATKIIGLAIVVTGNLALLKIEPGATNPITWLFGGTTPSLTLTPSTGTACIGVIDGTHSVMSATVRNLKLTNTGTATATYEVYALVGS